MTNEGENERPNSRFHPDNLGELFWKLFAAAVVSFYLSIIGFVLYVAQLSGDNHSFAMTDLPVLIPAGSWVGMLVSLGCYAVWSIWKLRKLRREMDRPADRSLVKKLNHAAMVLNADRDELDAYDTRLNRTLWSILGMIFVLLIPVGIFFG